MPKPQTSNQDFDLNSIVKDILDTVDRERERTIIARRFGLFDRKETLEQIGEELGITRERVRQLEKATMAQLKSKAASHQLPHIEVYATAINKVVHEIGSGVARITDVCARLTAKNTKIDQSRISFLARLNPSLVVIEDNDEYHHGVGIVDIHDEKVIKKLINSVVEVIKKAGKPVNAKHIAQYIESQNHQHAHALATLSKKLASLNDHWGLSKWPLVNPKNIRDKIYLILHKSGKHMHFNEIAENIKKSEFKRNDVTVQAIHNELIKDDRFVLVGRGIYALKEWGYKKGTVADIIQEVLTETGKPMHRDDIVQAVLKSRHVKETTILLNLQSKPQFKRVAKATYGLAE